jgi:uncharacterized protein (TIGR02594 family)
MTHLPAAYAWLGALDAPRTIDEALRLFGTQEVLGDGSNPEILRWAIEVGVGHDYRADSVPWCGLFAAVVVQRAGWLVPTGPLWARNWQHFGQAAPSKPSLGDVLVFKRGDSGHVGFYIAQDAEAFHVLGGNQGDAVSIVRIPRARLLAARRPLWRYGQPASVKPYLVAPDGDLSTNEA